MSYQNPFKSNIVDAECNVIMNDTQNYPDNRALTQTEAEALMYESLQKAYDEAKKVIDPDKEYPPMRF
jgi:hypothetical protein